MKSYFKNAAEYTAICSDNGTEIRGVLVIDDYSAKKEAFICPKKTLIVKQEKQNPHVDHQIAPLIGPFYRVDPETVKPVDPDAPKNQKFTAVCVETGEKTTGYLIRNGKSGKTYICRQIHLIVNNKTGGVLLGGFYPVIDRTVHPAGNMDKTDKYTARLEDENKRLAEENQKLKCELAAQRCHKAEAVKKQLVHFMEAAYAHEIETMRGACLELVAHKVSLDREIIAVFEDTPLNLTQCESLMAYNFTLLDRVRSKLYSALLPGRKPIFGEDDIAAAIAAVVNASVNNSAAK